MPAYIVQPGCKFQLGVLSFLRRLSATVIIVLLSFSSLNITAQSSGDDPLSTPFRKGRWLTGLSGSISSNSSSVRSSDQETTTNEFGLNVSMGKFLKDRFLFGGTLNIDRASAGGDINNVRETLFLGPFASYYLSPNPRGSLFTRLTTGYVRYRDKVQLSTLDPPTAFFSEGGGFGALIGLGYSYVIHDRIAFDIGFDLNLFWVGVEQTQEPSGAITSQNIAISTTAFTFGFNVILDDFSF